MVLVVIDSASLTPISRAEREPTPARRGPRVNRSGRAIWTFLTINYMLYALYVEVRHLVVYSFSFERV
jgi:hypothetical protein